MGHDFALGSGKEDARRLLFEAAPDQVDIKEIDSFKIEGEVCSSTVIRDLIRGGDVAKAATFLGYNFSLSGMVIKGQGNGKKHLVPTVNLVLDTILVSPGAGVYFTNTKVESKTYASITNIGFNPTIDDCLNRTIETHILDFSEDIYGQIIEVVFLEKCRDEKKFKSVSALKIEILKNIQQRRSYQC